MLFRGRVIQFRETGPENFAGKLYHYTINEGHVGKWLVFLIWCVLTPIFVGAGRIKVRFLFVKLGMIGFILTVILFLSDPFGLMKYYND
jgi:hypothetical protein